MAVWTQHPVWDNYPANSTMPSTSTWGYNGYYGYSSNTLSPWFEFNYVVEVQAPVDATPLERARIHLAGLRTFGLKHELELVATPVAARAARRSQVRSHPSRRARRGGRRI
jgi:hypothetical protein